MINNYSIDYDYDLLNETYVIDFLNSDPDEVRELMDGIFHKDKHSVGRVSIYRLGGSENVLREGDMYTMEQVLRDNNAIEGSIDRMIGSGREKMLEEAKSQSSAKVIYTNMMFLIYVFELDLEVLDVDFDIIEDDDFIIDFDRDNIFEDIKENIRYFNKAFDTYSMTLSIPSEMF